MNQKKHVVWFFFSKQPRFNLELGFLAKVQCGHSAFDFL
jgi:hypothetical protein